MSAATQQYLIGEFCELVKGTSPTLKTEPGDYPLVVTAAFRRTSADWQIDGPAVCVPLVSSTGHGDAAIHRVHYQDGKFALANLLVALKPRKADLCDAKFLYHLLQTRKDELLVPLMLGTANVSLKERDIAGVTIPLPPLDEQRRIVARIEELALKVEEARGLRRIAIDETSALLPAYLGAKFRELASRYPILPLGELSSHVVDGPHQTPSYLPDANGVPFVTVKNMVTGKLSFENLNYVSRDDHRDFSRRCRAERGDVLYSKDGATKGRPCYVDTDEEFSFFVSVALIKPLRDRLDGRYLVHLLNSSWIKDRMIDKSRGDMIPHIVLREIRAFPVPLPPLHEQRRIVAELDALQAMVDAVKGLQAETAAELDAMIPAILDKAFKGEL
ncbi:restriction endonuclease subunit S [uncultured Hyphomicrobium sp.]|jgi:type I restriction enzyme S subunit|uniref:restriction endonuclease subunit S n=1 Tax=uncultured Hyphomicrobium sp. TaxID=194373 RepID=UPI0025D1B6D4|nr:restriction endonuclease subunit S [uncultured Hyphomicrobium sp.]